MPVTAAERRAMLAHAQQIDAYEQSEAAESARLMALAEGHIRDLAERFRRHAWELESWEVRELDLWRARYHDDLRLFQSTKRPHVSPWDTPVKLGAFITMDRRSNLLALVMLNGATRVETSAADKAAAEEQDRRDNCREAYRRVLAFANIVPSVRGDFPLSAMRDYQHSLDAIAAWCSQFDNVLPECLSCQSEVAPQAALIALPDRVDARDDTDGEGSDTDMKRSAAITMVVQHPGWSNRKIARLVGLSHTTLGRDPTYKRAKAAATGTPPPRGFRTDRGDVEAVDEGD